MFGLIPGLHPRWGRFGLVVGMWLLLPAAVLFGWPVLFWWMVRVLSRSAQPWFAAILVIVFGLQVDVLAQHPLGINVILLGRGLGLVGTVGTRISRLAALGGRYYFWWFVCGIFLLAGQFIPD